MSLDLTKIRNSIDAVDDKILKLFLERMDLCGKVAEYKKETSKAVLDNEREKAIISRLTSGLNDLDSNSVALLYKSIFEISRSRQHTLLNKNKASDTSLSAKIHDAAKATLPFPETPVVACQGVEGAYSQIACNSIFKSPSILYFENFESVFKSVESGLCKYGVLPFENSIYGSVNEVYDMLSKTGVSVVKSVKLPIHHALIAKKGTSLSDIKEIYSHKQAIGQCSEFLAANRKIKINICENTAKAAKMVSESERCDIAAISSADCAAIYGLNILKKDLQNSSVNFTMFYCISKDLEVYPDVTKTAFMFNIPNRSGALLSILNRFAAFGINLTKIESRPISGKDFEFMFYAEADTNGIDEKLLNLFDEFEESLDFFKFIGAYNEFCPS